MLLPKYGNLFHPKQIAIFNRHLSEQSNEIATKSRLFARIKSQKKFEHAFEFENVGQAQDALFNNPAMIKNRFKLFQFLKIKNMILHSKKEFESMNLLFFRHE